MAAAAAAADWRHWRRQAGGRAGWQHWRQGSRAPWVRHACFRAPRIEPPARPPKPQALSCSTHMQVHVRAAHNSRAGQL